MKRYTKEFLHDEMRKAKENHDATLSAALSTEKHNTIYKPVVDRYGLFLVCLYRYSPIMFRAV